LGGLNWRHVCGVCQMLRQDPTIESLAGIFLLDAMMWGNLDVVVAQLAAYQCQHPGARSLLDSEVDTAFLAAMPPLRVKVRHAVLHEALAARAAPNCPFGQGQG
jgi:hypothetical protein